ncbi:hypothetical protein OH764_34015 (plasmid) [Burkholderia sp. M6-3]
MQNSGGLTRRAYGEWQRAEPTGADRRAVAERSIVQHRSMFPRFHLYLTGRGVTVTESGTDHIDGFFPDLDRDCAPGTSTRLRYLKLLDRLSRHLCLLGLRPPLAHSHQNLSILVHLELPPQATLRSKCAPGG